MNGLRYAIQYMELRVKYLELQRELVRHKGEDPGPSNIRIGEANELLSFLNKIKKD